MLLFKLNEDKKNNTIKFKISSIIWQDLFTLKIKGIIINTSKCLSIWCSLLLNFKRQKKNRERKGKKSKPFSSLNYALRQVQFSHIYKEVNDLDSKDRKEGRTTKK